jgi:hypothetical protein
VTNKTLTVASQSEKDGDAKTQLTSMLKAVVQKIGERFTEVEKLVVQLYGDSNLKEATEEPQTSSLNEDERTTS